MEHMESKMQEQKAIEACADMPDPAAEIARLRNLPPPIPAEEIELLQRTTRDAVAYRYTAEAERDRLREANAEMLESLENLLHLYQKGYDRVSASETVQTARALLAKHSAHGQEKGG